MLRRHVGGQIAKLVEDGGCRLRVYADDLTISGESVPGAQIWVIKKTLYRHGHRYARSKERSVRDKSVEVTGVVLLRSGVVAHNRQHAKIVKVREEITRTASADHRKALERQLRGRLAQVGQIASADQRRKASGVTKT